MSYRVSPTIKRLLMIQCSVGLASVGLLSMWHFEAAYSALAGVMIGFLPNVYLALRVFNLSKGRSARSTLFAFYRGAAGKFIITVTLFIMAFHTLSPLHAPAMFGGFILVQMLNWAAPLFAAGRRSGDAPRWTNQ